MGSIASKTYMQWGWRLPNLLCLRCLVYCGSNTLKLSDDETITYYGCRSCSQSQDFSKWKGRIIAMLDNQIEVAETQQNDVIQANWLTRRRLFDFDAVLIEQASDEDVERFAVQVGNDTDSLRVPKYKQMLCLVSPRCTLSANTMRILKNTFGQVKVDENLIMGS